MHPDLMEMSRLARRRRWARLLRDTVRWLVILGASASLGWLLALMMRWHA